MKKLNETDWDINSCGPEIFARYSAAKSSYRKYGKDVFTLLSDLHTHSTASDGQYTPSELACLAKKRGLDLLALTDHDTVDGLDEAVKAGEKLGLRILRGIELSAREYGTFHILGYGINPEAPVLQALCSRMKEGRDERAPRLIAFLREKGMTISMDEVQEIAGGAIIGRPHFAQAMVRRGYVASNREAFDRYLDTDEFRQRVERPKPSVRECIEAIKDAGGKVSLAHPYQIGIGETALDALVGELAGCGLDAIECYYPRHTAEQTAFYLDLAKKYCLHITGGSDFHGERVKPDIKLAALELDLGWLQSENVAFEKP